jgi:phage terminase large subunit-like protein
MMQLRAQPVERFYRQQHIHHAQKFRDAEIVIVHLGQKLAHQRIEHAFHWGQ